MMSVYTGYWAWHTSTEISARCSVVICILLLWKWHWWGNNSVYVLWACASRAHVQNLKKNVITYRQRTSIRIYSHTLCFFFHFPVELQREQSTCETRETNEIGVELYGRVADEKTDLPKKGTKGSIKEPFTNIYMTLCIEKINLFLVLFICRLYWMFICAQIAMKQTYKSLRHH
jgi:hypothetical protein